MAAPLPFSTDTALLQQIERVANIGGWELDPQTRELRWSAQMYRIREVDPAQFHPNLDNALDFYPPESRAHLAAAVQRAISDGTAWDIELDLITATGKRRRVRSIGDSEVRDGRCIRLTGTVQDITERHEAREALRAREAETRRLAAVAENTSNVVIVTDAGHRIEWVNRSFTRITGYTLAEVAGRTPRELLNRDETERSPRFADAQRQLQDGQAVDSVPLQLYRKSGEAYWAMVEVRPICDEHGTLTHFIHIQNDITALRHAEEEQSRLAESLHIAADAADIGIVVRDLRSGEAIWDARTFRIYGFPIADRAPSRDELLTHIHPDDRAAFERDWSGAYDGGRGEYDSEYRAVHPDGRVVYVYARGQFDHDEDGKPLRFVGVVIDVSRRRLSEQHAREADEWLRFAGDAIDIGMFENDLDKGTSSWNAAMRRLHGLAPDEPVPDREEWRERFVHPDDREMQRRHALKLADGNSPYELEYRIRRGDGALRWLYTRAIRAPGTGDCRVLGVTIDITERKRSEERLQLATASTGIGIYERDVETGTAYWDPQMFRLFGLPPAATPPKFKEMLQWIHPDDRAQFWQRREELLRADPAGEFEIRVRGADGVERALMIRTTCERTIEGRVTRLAGVAIDVTESRRIARALHEALERLRLATETSGIGTWERNLLTGEARWDPTMYTLYGLNAADGPPTREVAVRMVHPDDRAVVISAWQRIQQVTHAVEFEYRLVKPDGQIVHLNTRGIAEREADGHVTRILGATIDITARQAAQSQLREFDEWLRLAGEATGIGFFQVAADGSVRRFDRQIRIMYGFDPEGPMPTAAQIEAIILPEDRPQMQAARTRALQSDEPVDTEYRIRLPGGAVRHIFTRRVRRCDVSGKPIYVVGSSVDVTDSRRVQRERDLLYDRMQLAAESLGLGIWDWDLLADTSVWNDQMHALYGRRREESGGRIWSDFVHPDDRERSQAMIMKAIAETGQCDIEFRVVLPDGGVRWIASRGRVQRDQVGVPVRMIGVSWDVTDKRLAEAALRDKEAAERTSQAKSELLSRVSHELRTPLNAILGFAQVLGLDRKNPLTPVQSDRVRQIESAGWHLLNLINEVLELSRIEAGRLSLSLTSVPLAGAIHESVELISSSAAQCNIAIELHFDAQTPATVRADPTRLKQVLLNLLSNAVKYNRDGGRIDIAIGRAGHAAQISVRDTGHGMSEQQLAQLFQPFNRLGFETSPIEGSGIGLTITRHLIELMGGRIEVTSRSGEGTEFRVRLPIEEELPAASSPSGTAVNTAIRPASTATVLYVEDNRSNRELVREVLALRPGIRLLEATSGTEGLALAASSLPDLALVDMRLPDMDGIELLRRLRAAVNGSVPCVVLSADAMPSDRARALQAGFLDYWTKPIVAAEFLQALDRTLSRQRETTRH